MMTNSAMIIMSAARKDRERWSQIEKRIGYPGRLMWDMTVTEVEAYSAIKGHANLVPESLLDKYSLRSWTRWNYPEGETRYVSPCHYLVVRYCEDHPEIGERFARREIMYFEVLSRAEVEYLGLPFYKQRNRSLPGLAGMGI